MPGSPSRVHHPTYLVVAIPICIIQLVLSSTAILACSDICKTVDFYKLVLGFENSWTYGDPPTFGSVSGQGVTLMFCLQPEIADHIEGHQHWIQTKNINELYLSHKSKGARIVSELDDKPWGMREYTVRDLNGYHLRFAQIISPPTEKSKKTPHDLTIEVRNPSQEEYASIAGKLFNHKTLSPRLVAGTWNGVVASLPHVGPIGVLRIMEDSPGWFSIWDVAVLPEWQYQGIGTLMIEAAIKLIKTHSPSAIVYLFTFKHGFYERLGFKQESVSLLRF